MQLSIIVIGDEILIGQVTDTNSGFISRCLEPLGMITRRVITVGDNEGDIRETIEKCMSDSDLVVTTGGLGPTKDDITKSVLCSIFGGQLKHDPEVAENIKNVFQLKGLKMNPLTEAQAMVPTSCKVIQNRLGTAPIMWFERDGKVLVSMPGVPFETEGMMKAAVAEVVRQHFVPDIHAAHRVVMVSGISESALAQLLDDFEVSLPECMHLAYLPTPGLIRLRLDCSGSDSEKVERLLDEYTAKLKSDAGEYIIYDGDATAAEIAVAAARRKKFKIASAESCTGGNIAHSITMVAGCSDVYVGSVVSYANDVKTRVLAVSDSDIAKFGAVSSQVVEQMAVGVAEITGADCAVATSGIAGPGGGTSDKPVGTVWIAVHTPDVTKSFVKHYPGNRERVIERATVDALLALINAISLCLS